MTTEPLLYPPDARSARSRAFFSARYLAVVAGYALTIGWFQYADIYHTDFSSVGLMILVNNIARCAFIFYLFWVIQVAGAILLRAIDRPRLRAQSKALYLVLTFSAGTGAWHLVLFLVGCLNLLYMPIMLLLTLPFVALAPYEMGLVGTGFSSRCRKTWHDASASTRLIFVLLLLSWLLLLLGKGLYPGGSQDYFVHYFPSYQGVLKAHSLWANQVWWHYLNTKGAVLIYLSMLLTDPLAPQLVVFCFMSVAGLIVFVFVRRLMPGTNWPPVAALLFFTIYDYTPRWGEFGKLHEIDTFFVIAVLLFTVVLIDENTAPLRGWFVAMISTLLAAIIATPELGPFLCGVFALVGLIYGLQRKSYAVWRCCVFAVWTGAVLAGMLLLNLITVGLPYDVGYSVWWRLVDVEKLYRWGALPSFLWMDSKYSLLSVTPSLRGELGYLYTLLRLHLFWPLVCSGAGVLLISAWRRARTRVFGLDDGSRTLLVCYAAIAVVGALYIASGGFLAGSFFRATSFIVPVVIVAGTASWATGFRQSATGRLAAIARHPGIPIGMLIACVLTMTFKAPLGREFLQTEADAIRFALGTLSIDDAYAHHHSEILADSFMYRDADKPPEKWGGIYPGARGAYAVVGPDTPIWTLTNGAYCMLPDCRMLSFPNFIMVRSWDRVMWGTPDEGRRLLQEANLNYFLVSTELPVSDPLPFSPLFSPDNIGRYLGIRWTDGVTSLLTWSGPETTPIDAAWIAGYRRALSHPSGVLRYFPAAAIETVFDQLRASPHPWQPFLPPWRRP